MALREVQWEVTNNCNLRCKHCVASSGRKRLNELSTDEALHALEVFRCSGVTRVSYTGGEPFSRSDFRTILRRTGMMGLATGVITNGTMLRQADLETLLEFGVRVGISLDGADVGTNDAIRGDGAFKAATGTLSACAAMGIPTQLYVTVMRTNIGQLRGLMELAKTLGCKGVRLNEVNIVGRARTFAPILALRLKECASLLAVVGEITAEVFGQRISQPDDECWVDGSSVFMASNGDLYLCSEILQRSPRLTIGNIRNKAGTGGLFGNPLARVQPLPLQRCKCCYHVSVSEDVTLVTNSKTTCPLVCGGSP